MLLVRLGELLLPGRRHYAPIDARALEQYPILRKVGLFPIDMSSARGAAQFLRTAEAILREGGVLWITPQGRFADPRELPLAFRPGLAALALRRPEVPLIPLAIEYTFWDERLPEALVRFADPVHVTAEATTAEATRDLENRLAAAMYALQGAAIARDSSAFKTLFAGSRGTGGAYALMQRVRRFLGGRPVKLDHTARVDG